LIVKTRLSALSFAPSAHSEGTAKFSD